MVTAAWLASFAYATLFYEAKVVLHLVLGVMLVLVALVWLRYPVECGVFLGAAILDLYLVIRGNTFDHRRVLAAHVIRASIALALIGEIGSIGHCMSPTSGSLFCYPSFGAIRTLAS